MDDDKKPNLVAIDVVLEPSGKSIRCIYLNNRRIAGAKPYTSENLRWLSISGEDAEILKALGV